MARREEFLDALGGVPHRPLQRARGEGDDDVLRIDGGLHPESAADVADDDAYALLRNFQNRVGELVAESRRSLAAHEHRQTTARVVVGGERRARLDRAVRDALVDEIERDDVLRALERRRCGGGIAVAGLARDVVGRLGDDHGCACRGRSDDVDHSRERLIVDLHGVRGVAGFERRRGDHRDDGLADKAHGVDRKRMPRRRRRARAIAALEVGRMGNRLDAGVHEIVSGENARDSWHRGRRADVDMRDARVRMGRAHEARVELAGGRQVVGEPPLAAQQRIILDALHRIAAAEAAGLPCSHGDPPHWTRELPFCHRTMMPSRATGRTARTIRCAR